MSQLHFEHRKVGTSNLSDMASKLWLLVEWVDESSVTPAYAVVSVNTQAYNEAGMQPGKITNIRVNKNENPRRGKVLCKSECKDDVIEAKLRLECEQQHVKNVMQIFKQTMKKVESKDSFGEQQTNGHRSVRKVLDLRSNNNDSSSDSDANVQIAYTKSGNFSKFTPQYKHQQSTSKQTRSTSNANDDRSNISCTPLPSTSARTNIPYTPQNKHQQSTSKLTQDTSNANDDRSNISCTPLPSTSARTDIPYTPQNEHQQSTSKLTRDTSNANDDRSNISSTPPPSTSAQKDQKTSSNQGSQTQDDRTSAYLSFIDKLEILIKALYNKMKDLLDDTNNVKMGESISMSEKNEITFSSLLPLLNLEQNLKKDLIKACEKNERRQNVREQNIGEQNIGEQNVGEQNGGELNVGEQNVGEQNVGEMNVGEMNVDEQNVGEQNVGEQNVGEQNVFGLNVGEQNIGEENVFELNVDEQNVCEQNVDELNVGDQNVGEQNVFELNVDEQNVFEQNVGEQNVGEQNVGEQNVVELNVGEPNLGDRNVGDQNVGEIELNYYDNEDVGAEEVIENNGGEQQADLDLDQTWTVNAEQESNPNTRQIHWMATLPTDNMENNMIPIGHGHAKVPEIVLRETDWSLHTQATRNLFKAVFPQSVLATHSLISKQSPAFSNKPAKEMLDLRLVEDIVQEVSINCDVTQKTVRKCISRHCIEEAKLNCNRSKPKKARKAQDENEENISPSTSSSDE